MIDKTNYNLIKLKLYFLDQRDHDIVDKIFDKMYR